MRRASFFMSSLALRDFSNSTISSAWAWWPIMPCMNLMSAPTYCTCDRSDAWSAVITLLAWPGAPGCTIGGGESMPAVVLAPFTGAVRHDAAATAVRRSPTAFCDQRFMTRKGYTLLSIDKRLDILYIL